MNSVPLEDRLEIQELVARYAFRCDTRRYSEIGELFAVDGVFDETVIGLPLCTGRAAIVEFFPSVDAALEFLIHITTNHQLTAYAGDTARGTCHLLCEGRFLGQDIRIRGYYDDDYIKADGAWRFKRRTLVEIAPSTGFPT